MTDINVSVSPIAISVQPVDPLKIGPAGPKGDKGDKGDTGDTGPQGIQGIQGPAGTNGLDGAGGDDGWSPVPAIISDGERRVLQVVDWTGGTGTKPAVGKYIGATGLVDLIADGVDIRGAVGGGGGGDGWTYITLSSTVNIPGTAYVDIGNITFSALASSVYEFEALGEVSNTSTGNGFGVRINLAVAPAFINGLIDIRTVDGGGQTPTQYANGQAVSISTQMITGTTLSPFYGRWLFRTGTSTGAASLQARNEGVGALVLDPAKLIFRYRKVA